MVALAFIPNLNNSPLVNHKDENVSNNTVDNLEWCTHKYNSNYGTRNKRISESLSKKVCQYTLDNKLIKVWNSSKERTNCGFDNAHVLECCRGKRKTHKGYKWSYKK